MIEPVVVPFSWLILFLLIVIHDADQQNKKTGHTISEPEANES